MKHSMTKDKMLEVLFEHPTEEFHLRELSRIIKISTPSATRALNELKKDNMVVVKKDFLLKIKANLDNEDFKLQKRIFNLKKIYSSGLFKYLKDKFLLSAVILFGSYSRAEDTEKSDIDIVIIGKEKDLDLEKYEKILNKRINIQFINLKNISKELRNSIINGIPLQGYIET